MNFPVVAKTNLKNVTFNITVVFINENTGIVVESGITAPYKEGDIKNSFNNVNSDTWDIVNGDISRYIVLVKKIAYDKKRELDLINLSLK